MKKSMTKSNHSRPVYTSSARHDIPKRRGLSRDEEHELAGLIANGDRDARNRLVVANLGLVVVIAREFRRKELDMDDLISEGNLGLIRAAEKFDPSFGIPFRYYARYWIKEKILAALMNTAHTVRIPAHMFRLLLRWRRAESMLCGELGRVPRFEDTAAVLELSPAQKSLVAHAHAAAQLEHRGGPGSELGHRSIDDVLDRESPCEEMVDSEEELVIAQRRMDRLDIREQAIVSMRYGLESEPLTLRAIGRLSGMTREGVRQIEIRAMHKLQADHDPRSFDSNTASRLPVRTRGVLPRR